MLTGDAYDFRPAANSIFKALLGTDLNQSQFLDLETYSQELRLTSPGDGRVSWIVGRLLRAHQPLHLHRQQWSTPAPACSRCIASRG